jgi:cystinosin
VDFPVLNLLGFSAYMVSTAAFLFSPTVREQYAARHPASPEPTVRFNDFAFALHAVVLCTITYSQFFPSIWGLSVPRKKPSRLVILIVIFSLIAAFVSVVKVLAQGESVNSNWQWIDVVSIIEVLPFTFLNEIGLYTGLHQTRLHSCEVLSPGVFQL